MQNEDTVPARRGPEETLLIGESDCEELSATLPLPGKRKADSVGMSYPAEKPAWLDEVAENTSNKTLQKFEEKFSKK